jgi:putative DNA primase/helicase
MSYEFIAFARAHGVEIDPSRLDDSGKLRRCATVEHPRSKNGAYVWDGKGGFVWAWDGDGVAIRYQDPRAPAETEADRARARARRQLLMQERVDLRTSAEAKAAKILDSARPDTHDYLHRKGFPDATGLVLPGGELFIPMRDQHQHLVGGQVIKWLPEEMRWEKKYIYGQQSDGAMLRLGPRHPDVTFLVEGYATALSVELACRQMRLRAAVIVTFSAHNLKVVAKLIGGKRVVIADHDAPQRDPVKARINPGCTGQFAAAATGLPWAAPEYEGMDANDLHVQYGLPALCRLLVGAMRGQPVEYRSVGLEAAG